MSRFGIVVFPGTWSDRDCAHALAVAGHPSVRLWHQDQDLQGVDCVILPGGFSYGDYLRAGAIASHAPIMAAVRRHVDRGGLVLGICNGFQVLCEAGLLPGALLRNAALQFRCQPVTLRVERVDTPFSHTCRAGARLRIPVSHGEGRYYADPAMLARLEQRGQVLFRYVDAAGRLDPEANPNGSVAGIAGIVNERGTVLGMMPHPERACEMVLGSADGLRVFQGIAEAGAGAAR